MHDTPAFMILPTNQHTSQISGTQFAPIWDDAQIWGDAHSNIGMTGKGMPAQADQMIQTRSSAAQVNAVLHKNFRIWNASEHSSAIKTNTRTERFASSSQTSRNHFLCTSHLPSDIHPDIWTPCEWIPAQRDPPLPRKDNWPSLVHHATPQSAERKSQRERERKFSGAEYRRIWWMWISMSGTDHDDPMQYNDSIGDNGDSTENYISEKGTDMRCNVALQVGIKVIPWKVESKWRGMVIWRNSILSGGMKINTCDLEF